MCRPLYLLYIKMRRGYCSIRASNDMWYRYLKVVGSISGRNDGRNFFSRVNYLCWLLFRHQSKTIVTAVARRRLGPFCQKCRCMAGYSYSRILVHPWPNEVDVGWQCCSGIVLEANRKTSSHANHQEKIVQSSQVAGLLWNEPLPKRV